MIHSPKNISTLNECSFTRSCTTWHAIQNHFNELEYKTFKKKTKHAQHNILTDKRQQPIDK